MKSFERLRECFPILRQLSRAKTAKQRKLILKKAKNCVFYSICDISRTVLKGNFPISPKDQKRLSRHKKYLRILATKSGVSLKKRKYIINQNGGFLPQLLVPALSILAHIITSKILGSK